VYFGSWSVLSFRSEDRAFSVVSVSKPRLSKSAISEQAGAEYKLMYTENRRGLLLLKPAFYCCVKENAQAPGQGDLFLVLMGGNCVLFHIAAEPGPGFILTIQE